MQRLKNCLLSLSLAIVSTIAFASNGNAWLDVIGNKPQGGNPEKPNISVRLISKNSSLTPQAINEMAVVIDHKDGWHTYWRMPGDAGLKTKFFFNIPKNYDVNIPQFPLPERFSTTGLISFGYSGRSVFPFELDVPRFVRFGDKVSINVRVEYLACKDICVPGETTASIRLPLQVAAKEGPDADIIAEAKKLIPEVINNTRISASYEDDRIKINVPLKAGIVNHSLDFYPLEEDVLKLAQVPLYRLSDNGDRELYLIASDNFKNNPKPELTGVLIADGGPKNGGWAVETSIPLSAGTVPSIDELQGTAESPTSENLTPIQSSSENSSSLSLFSAALFALLGGLILNLMPCVFPVLSLKLLQLIKGSGESRNTLTKHGISFTAGILTTMLVLSGTLIALRSSGELLGWGFQLQNPIVVSILLFLFIAISLNLLGLFEVNIGGKISDKLSEESSKKSEFTNSFLTGALAVVVASPCTAPFMGAALGYALTQSALKALIVFLFLGIGMSLPWLLLCLFPEWSKKLPKPGPWMETFKKVMAAPMLLASLWLAWVLSKQVDFSGILVIFCGLAAGAISLWLLGREQWGKGKNRPLMLFTAIMAISSIVVASSPSFEKKAEIPQAQIDSGWKPWSKSAVSLALASGKPVFVDFTAAWCVTCQANKFTAIHTKKVEEKMNELGYAKFVADWTNKDPVISQALEEFGRSGVPLYLIYKTDGSVEILPELLTPDIILDAL